LAAVEHRKALLFRVGAQLCALPLDQVVETMRPLPLRPVSGAPPGVVGLSLIRGTALPVIDIGVLFGQNTAHPQRLVIAKTAQRRFAVFVDEVIGIRPIAAEALQALPPLMRDADPLGLERLATLDGELMLLLNAARLAPAEWQERQPA
jgi:purine-binding chemotaxis protein CheW